MTLNPDLIRQRCQEIAESLARLEHFQPLAKADFLANQQTPEDYAACFARVAEAGLISQPLAERLQQMARFRNLLVHMYWRIDYQRVYDILQKDLGDWREFGAVMAAQV